MNVCDALFKSWADGLRPKYSEHIPSFSLYHRIWKASHVDLVSWPWVCQNYRGVTIHRFCNSNQFKSQSFVIKSNQFTSDHNAKIDQFKSIQITQQSQFKSTQVFESDLKWFANQLRKNRTRYIGCLWLGAENSILCVIPFWVQFTSKNRAC